MFDPNRSYDSNYKTGPQIDWVVGKNWPLLRYLDEPRFMFLGYPLHIPFGIPAGPLLNASYMQRAIDAGFCMTTYKTVRSKTFESHPLPNILEVVGPQFLGQTLSLATTQSSNGFSISNSFGVPSKEPKVWQNDFNSVARTVGFLNVLSLQPTAGPSFDDFILDARCVAKYASQTAGTLFEINLSCPNEDGLPLYLNLERTIAVLTAIRDEIPNRHLIAKIGVLQPNEIVPFVRKICEIVDGISAINTLRCRIVDAQNNPALGPQREFGGVCGQLIFDQGTSMINSLASARKRLGLAPSRFGFVGVGGVFTPEHVSKYLEAGADVVQSATGSMWNLYVAEHVATSLRVRTERKRAPHDLYEQTRSHKRTL